MALRYQVFWQVWIPLPHAELPYTELPYTELPYTELPHSEGEIGETGKTVKLN